MGGPDIGLLAELLGASNTPQGWTEQQSGSNQAFLIRCLAGIADMDTARQVIILRICRRALNPAAGGGLGLGPAGAVDAGMQVVQLGLGHGDGPGDDGVVPGAQGME